MVFFSTHFEPNPGSAGTLTTDPASGGWLVLDAPGGATAHSRIGLRGQRSSPNLDLRADGCDRFVIDVQAASTGNFGSPGVILQVGRDEGYPDGKYAGVDYSILGPGPLVIPCAELAGLEDFDDNVGLVRLTFHAFQVDAANELTLAQFRTATTPTADEPASWDRIERACRR